MPRQRAFTLIELLVTIVVIALASTALLGVYSTMVRGSADPVIQQQAITVAEAYMEEILRKAYKEPRDPVIPETGSAEPGETRASYNDVQDYNSLPDNQVRDQNNNLIPLLTDYAVTVNVDNDPALRLNAVPALRIDIAVTHPAISAITLSAFRTEYPPP